MTFAPFNAHTNPIFQELELLKVQDVIKTQQLKLVFDFHTGGLREDLMSLFQLTTDVQTTNLVLNSENRNLLYLPPFKTMTYGKRSIKYQCPKIWNHTFKTGTLQITSDKNVNIESIKTIQNFKKKHKTTLSLHIFIKRLINREIFSLFVSFFIFDLPCTPTSYSIFTDRRLN